MHTAWLSLTLSTVVTFALLLLLARWIGSTQLTQLTFFNWVAGASMGNIAANMIDAKTASDWWSNAYALVVFTFASVAAAFLALKSRQFRRVANGEPVVLIHRGVLMRGNLRRTKVNVDVLMMLLREKGYFSYKDVDYAIMEPTGNLSILPTVASQSASKRDLADGPDLSDKGQGPYMEIVIDGDVDADKLRESGYDNRWLQAQLRDVGVSGPEDVLYLAVNKEGEILVDLKHRDEESSRK